MKYIAIFCSSQDIDDKYIKPAREFANLLVSHDYHLVWGGTDTGLMKIIAGVMAKGGGKLVGVSIEVFKNLVRKDAHEMIIAKNLGERKTTMLTRSDAIAVLVGGIGTLDELMNIVELKKQKKHKKPIVVLNTLNFYEGLIKQLKKMKKEGFIPTDLEDLLYFANSPKQAFDYINGELNKRGSKSK